MLGIAYGGTYGLVMAMVLEAVPRKSRGIVAGFTQQGFAAGYLLASGLHLAMSMAIVKSLTGQKTNAEMQTTTDGGRSIG